MKFLCKIGMHKYDYYEQRYASGMKKSLWRKCKKCNHEEWCKRISFGSGSIGSPLISYFWESMKPPHVTED